MNRLLIIPALLMTVSFSACASVPTGPSDMALPGTGKSFDQFRVDDFNCRQYAHQQVGGETPEKAEQRAAVKSAVIGTVIGAAAGAAIGSASGNVGEGAAIGGGAGLLFGGAAGSGYAASSRYEAQRRYDHAYMQCMYALGHKIPVYGQFRESFRPEDERPEPYPPADYPPPPPPGR